MDLQRYLADEPVLASPPSAAYRFRKFARRHKAELLTAAVIGLVLLAAAASVSWALWDSAEQRAVNNLRAKHNRENVAQSLARLDEMHKQYLWNEALALLDRTAALIGSQGDPDLRERITQAKRKTKLLQGLDKALQLREMYEDGDTSKPGAPPQYRKTFTEYGLDVQAGQIEGLAKRIRAEEPAVRERSCSASTTGWFPSGRL